MQSLQIDEQRKFKRFQVKKESSFVMNPGWPAMGELIDISTGGFAFKYIADDKWPYGNEHGHVIFGDHDSCLNDLPVNIVADQVVTRSSQATNYIVRRRCMKFGDLSDEQKFLVECFIWINGVCEC